MSKAGPTQRTLEWLRKQGWTAAVVEKRIPKCFVLKDLFGFIDIVAMRTDTQLQPESDWDWHAGILGVQATSGVNTSSRMLKILDTPESQTWLDAGGRIIVVGWRQLVKRNKDGSKSKRMLWKPKIQELAADGVVTANF